MWLRAVAAAAVGAAAADAVVVVGAVPRPMGAGAKARCGNADGVVVVVVVEVVVVVVEAGHRGTVWSCTGEWGARARACIEVARAGSRIVDDAAGAAGAGADYGAGAVVLAGGRLAVRSAGRSRRIVLVVQATRPASTLLAPAGAGHVPG